MTLLTDEQMLAALPTDMGAVRLPPGWKAFARNVEAATIEALRAQADAQPVAEYQRRMRHADGAEWTEWTHVSEAVALDCQRTPIHNGWLYEVRKLYTKPAPESAPWVSNEEVRALEESANEMQKQGFNWHATKLRTISALTSETAPEAAQAGLSEEDVERGGDAQGELAEYAASLKAIAERESEEQQAEMSAGAAESWKRNAEDIAVQTQSLQDAILKAGRDYVRSFLMADEIPAFDAAMATADMRHGKAAQQQAEPVGVAEGYVVVPREATHAMHLAGETSWELSGIAAPNVSAIYSAMVAAAPAQQAEPVGDGRAALELWRRYACHGEKLESTPYHAARAAMGTNTELQDKGLYLAIQAYLRAAQSGQRAGVAEVPKGWTLVPITPTPHMAHCGGRIAASGNTINGYGKHVLTENGAEEVWRAMLAAAPVPAARGEM